MRHRFRIAAFASLFSALAGCGSDQTGMQSQVSASGPGVTVAQGPADAANSRQSVGGVVSGLQGSGLTLQLNGEQNLSVANNGAFVFPTPLTSGATYLVSVKNQPALRREVCALGNASGTLAQTSVTDITVHCSIVSGFLYSASGPNNQIQSYGISAHSGELLPIGPPLATGVSPLSIVSSPGGKFLYVANEASNSISVYAVASDTGALSAIGSAIATPHPSNMVMSATGRLVVFGWGYMLSDPNSVSVFAVDAVSGALSPIGRPLSFASTTYVTLAISLDGKFLYMLATNSYQLSSPATVTAYAIDEVSGALTAGPVLTLNLELTTMVIDPLGRFLYLTSNQTSPFHESATVLPYAIDSNTGALTAMGAGTQVVSNAAGFAADPSGSYLYIIDSFNSTPADNTVTALAIDQSTGTLTPIGSVLPIGGQPNSIVCDPSGRFIYVTSFTDNYTRLTLSSYTISTSADSAGQPVPDIVGGYGVTLGTSGSLSAPMTVID